MSEEPKKKPMDLNGDGKVTLDEAKEFAKQKFAELKVEAAEVAHKAKDKASEIGSEVKDLYADAKEKIKAKKDKDASAA